MRKAQAMSQGMGMHGSPVHPCRMATQSNDQGARSRLMGEVPALSVGSSPLNEGAKILQFPQPTVWR